MTLSAVVVMGLARSLLYCSSDDAQTQDAGTRTDDVAADCRGYCAAQAQAACAPPIEPAACQASCLRTVEAHGNCGTSWRAVMRCIADVGLTCTPSGPQANGCLTEYSDYATCLSKRIDGGPDAGGQGQ